MKNEKVENQKMEDVYNKEYLPSIVRVGRAVWNGGKGGHVP